LDRTNLDISFFSRKRNKLPITVILVGSVLISLLFQNEAWAERHFWVYFHMVRVINDHDPEYSGEWRHFITNINGQQQVNLEPGTNLMYANGEWIGPGDTPYPNPGSNTYWLQDKRVEVTIPDNGTIRILTTGIEEDGFRDYSIPDLSRVTQVINGRPVIENPAQAVEIARDMMDRAIRLELDPHDVIYPLVKDFSPANNFGLGTWHDDRSVTPPGSCNFFYCIPPDYSLLYLIEEFKPVPTDSLIVEIFTDANFSGLTQLINKNTRFLGDAFHDSVTNVRVHQGPGYQPRDVVQICEDPDYGNPCITLGPGDHDIGPPPYSFNDKADSIWFIRP
jgi:hypothetical protein